MSLYTTWKKPQLVMYSVSTIDHDNLAPMLKLLTSLSKTKALQLIGVSLLRDPRDYLGMAK